MLAIGVDIGGTKIAAGVVDEDGRLLASTRRDTDPEDPAAIEDSVADAVEELRRDHEVGVVGVSAAGFVGRDRSTVVFAANIAWRDYPLGEVLRQRLALPVVVENDANAAGWAEFRFGAGRDVEDMIMLTVGTGLGGAIVTDGRLLRGASGAGAEVGHLRVVPNGRACGCGHDGCLERYVSGTALVRETRAALETDPDRAAHLIGLAEGKPKRVTGPMVTQAAKEGDQFAVDMLAELGRWLGTGMAALSAVLDPALYVVGGGVCEAGDLLLEPAREALDQQLFARGRRPLPTIVIAELGNDAGIVGAADLARSH
ncbi:glucokinase [Salana multivorans]|uniref:Glucokinase n=1 Tax=Salana multivorans TaxID=120377 RepID=A0A3N2D2I4_9MICO|nr:ROK family glucokinase [Salana multivorans]OJX94463.1 MAG: glucokinase [Micrococcales bacterium 73-15]ROR93694.1 glucokinase [Salana multivorans]